MGKIWVVMLRYTDENPIYATQDYRDACDKTVKYRGIYGKKNVRLEEQNLVKQEELDHEHHH